MTTSTTYIGSRPPLAELLRDESNSRGTPEIQVIDIVGASHPSIAQINDLAVPDRPTVILSVRRYDLTDALASDENHLMEWLQSALIFRTAPIDRSIEMYWGWASATGVLLSAFHPSGTAWVHTGDVADAVQRMDPTTIQERNGRAFDITGPERVSMEKLRAEFSAAFDTSITVDCDTQEATASNLMRTGVPTDVANWLTWYQASVSDPRLPPTTNVLAGILGRTPQLPRLIPELTESKDE